jgi:hypothetical protein
MCVRSTSLEARSSIERIMRHRKVRKARVEVLPATGKRNVPVPENDPPRRCFTCA